jgi:lipopolysaccharide export system permease protein
MKKIDKLILSSFIGPFILTTLVVVFILLLQTMLRYFDEFFGKGIGFTVFLEMFFYFALNITPQALPLAVLLSSLITYGNLGEHYELTAIKSSGISLTRTLSPIFVFVVLLTISAFYFNNLIVPKTNLRAYSVLWDIRQKKPTLDFTEGAFYNGLEGFSVKVEKKLPDDKTLLGVMIYDHTKPGNDKLILADSGIMKTIYNDRYLSIQMFNGNYFSESEERSNTKKQFIRSEFDEMTSIFSLESFQMGETPKEMFANNRQMKTIAELEKDGDSIRSINKTLTKELAAFIKQYYSFHTHNLDTLKLQVNLDSIKRLKTPLTKTAKEQILTAAINEARTVKSTFSSYTDRFKKNDRDANAYEIEKYRKYTASVACLVMFLIGAPLGAIIKKGGLGIPVLISIAFFITFYVLTITSEKWAKEGLVDVVYSSWTPNAILFPIGLFFLRQARNDARLFDSDVYLMYWNKLKGRFRKKKLFR